MKRGQIWIETVIYTLTGLTIIGLILAIVIPRIRDMTDKSLIEQTISDLVDLDEVISGTLIASGNIRTFELTVEKGEYVVDSQEDSIFFTMATDYKYSEVGENVTQGEIVIRTEEDLEGYNVKVILDYSDSLNITFNGREFEKIFTSAPTPYKVQIENLGKSSGSKNNLNLIDL